MYDDDRGTARRLTDDRDVRDGQPFLASHKALAVCAREVARLTEGIAGAVTALGAAVGQKPEVRHSPGRCIVQLGPVALTVAWLRSALDPVAEGELLAIVWRGSVARRAEHVPERAAAQGAPPAEQLWEEVLVPVATDEASWRWQPSRADAAALPSQTVAERCVERLRRAYEEATSPAAATA